MRHKSHLALASSVFAGFALALAACSDSSSNQGTNPPNTTPLTQAEASAVADEMRGEVTAAANGTTIEGMLNPSLVMPGEQGAFEGPRAFSNPIDCPTLSEFPPTDADGDHIPDDLTITYDLDKCTFSNPHRNAVFTISGTIHIVDPSDTDKGIRVEFGSLEHKFTVQDSIFWSRHADGALQLLASTNGFSAIDSTTVGRESSRWPSAELAKRWAVNFTTDTAGFSLGRRLPSGDLTVNGSTTRTRGEDVKSFTVETVTPLHFDATCHADDRITSGELNVEFVRDGQTTTINIVWNGCGVDPTVTVTPTPTT